MPRVKRGFTKHRRHTQVLRMVKGHRTSRGHLYRTARQELMRSLAYAYRDRRTRKRDMRALWITRINAAARQHGLPYNRFMAGLIQLGITLDRKVLADMAVNGPLAFAALVYQVRGEAMPDDVRARYIPAPVAAVTPAPKPVVTQRMPPAATTPTTPPAATVETEPVAASADTTADAEVPTQSLAEQEAEESGHPLEHAGTTDEVEEGHGDPQQGMSR